MICLDVNVVLEVLLGRGNAEACRTYIASAQGGLGISLLTLDIVLYYAERHKLNLRAVQGFLRTFVWLPIVETDAEQAFAQFGGDDFEDALQIACAQRERCNRFATLDRGLAKKYAAALPIDLVA